MRDLSQQQSPSHVGAALSDLILHPVQTFLYNWYLMRRGSLLVGVQVRTFGSDLKLMPRMVIDFVAWIPRNCYRLLRSFEVHLQA